MSKDLSVGIILYNPNIKKVKKQVNELYDITKKIYLVDNASKNIEDIKKMSKEKKKVKLISNPDNYGVAKALNQITKEALEDSIDWVITLDQDSFASQEMIQKMLPYKLLDISMICPQIIDINKEYKKNEIKCAYQYTNRCITSGTIMNVNDIKKVGYFDEKMFIDYVDFDICKRLILNNKKIIRVNEVHLSHEVGKRTKRKFLFWTVYPTNHNPNRTYYYVRNINYYLRKYKNKLSKKEKKYEHKVLLWRLICIVFYEENKKEKLKNYIKGKKESKKMI